MSFRVEASGSIAPSGKVAVVASKEPAELVAFVSLREGEELELAAR